MKRPVSEQLALPTSDHGVAGSNPAGGKILPEPKRRFIAQSLSCSPFHRLEMTEILLKGRKTLTHPSILGLIIVGNPEFRVLEHKCHHFLAFNQNNHIECLIPLTTRKQESMSLCPNNTAF